jgi:HSP20 family protein
LALNGGVNGGGFAAFVPRINVAETENKIEVNVELPGVEKDDVEVTVANKMLTIEGHKKTESEKKEKDYRVVERTEGRFKRVIPLGFDVGDEQVDAQCKDGVLSIAINKPAELTQKARKIEVKNSESA